MGEAARLLILQTGVSFSFDAARRNPEHPRRREGINSPSLPPGDFVSGAMVVTVMDSAQRYGELVADLEPHRAGLGEPQMVGVGGASSTDQTGLRGNEFEVGFVAKSTGLTDGEFAFLDFYETSVGLISRRVVINGCLRGNRSRLFGHRFTLSGASPWSLSGARCCCGRLEGRWVGWGGRKFIRR
jgi:hypothetical protein